MRRALLVSVLACTTALADVPVAQLDAPLPVPMKAGDIAPVDGRLIPTGLYIATAKEIERCRASEESLKGNATTAVVPVIVAAVLALGAGVAVGYAIAKK